MKIKLFINICCAFAVYCSTGTTWLVMTVIFAGAHLSRLTLSTLISDLSCGHKGGKQFPIMLHYNHPSLKMIGVDHKPQSMWV